MRRTGAPNSRLSKCGDGDSLHPLRGNRSSSEGLSHQYLSSVSSHFPYHRSCNREGHTTKGLSRTSRSDSLFLLFLSSTQRRSSRETAFSPLELSDDASSVRQGRFPARPLYCLRSVGSHRVQVAAVAAGLHVRTLRDLWVAWSLIQDVSRPIHSSHGAFGREGNRVGSLFHLRRIRRSG